MYNNAKEAVMGKKEELTEKKDHTVENMKDKYE